LYQGKREKEMGEEIGNFIINQILMGTSKRKGTREVEEMSGKREGKIS